MTNAGKNFSTNKLMEKEIPAHLQRLAGHLGTISLGAKPSRKNFRISTTRLMKTEMC